MIRCVVSAIVIGLAGCGGVSKYAPVSGTVFLDDKPLANVMVTFQPIAEGGDDAGGVGSYALTDANGQYTLMATSEKPQAGAFVGKHRVRIATPPPKGNQASDSAAGSAKPFRDPIPEKYNSKSTLDFVVPAGGTTTADFNLVSR